jgi:hypothetical protein
MRIAVLAVAVCLSLSDLPMANAASDDARQPTSIAAQDLATALHILARRHGVQVVYRSELVMNHRTSGASGNLTLEEALAKLLDATGLTYRFLADKAITIIPTSAEDESSRVEESSGGHVIF